MYSMVTIFCFLYSAKSCCQINSFSLNCRNLSISTIPQINISDVIYFDVSHNFVSHLNASDFQFYKKLAEVHASYNHISFIGRGIFSSHGYIRILMLEHNLLKEFNSSAIFGQVSALQTLNLRCNKLTWADFSGLKTIQFLNVEINSIKALSLSPSNLNSLRELYLGENLLQQLTFPQYCNDLESPMRILDIHKNLLKDVSFLKECKFESLMELNIANNDISYLPQDTFLGLTNLVSLILDGNPLIVMSSFPFNGLYQLTNLHLNHLSQLNHVDRNVFSNLSNLVHLELCNSRMLANLSYDTMRCFTKLQFLDISNNSLTQISGKVFLPLTNLKALILSDNELTCDCSVEFLERFLKHLGSHEFKLSDFDLLKCRFSNISGSFSIKDVHKTMNCTDRLTSESFKRRQELFRPGSTVTLNCGVISVQRNDVVWIKTRARSEAIYFDDNHQISPSSRYYVTHNGSLIIENVIGEDVGIYECYTGEKGRTVSLKLDYETLSKTEFESMIVGLLMSMMFFLISILVVSVRACCMTCSQKEKAKKTSMKEVLTAMRTGFQFNRFNSYTSAQLERFTAFRSATMEQICAFKCARVGQLRKYKQASVNGVLHCLDKMRVHYSNQSLNVKVHCQQQFDKLRENYIFQGNKFRDSRSQQVKKIRDQYHTQALKIRGYGVYQISRLRDQYKIQQQNLMKLLELLDVGNCLHVIEEECSRTESVIFDSKLDECFLESKSIDDLEYEDADEENYIFESSTFHCAGDGFLKQSPAYILERFSSTASHLNDFHHEACSNLSEIEGTSS